MSKMVTSIGRRIHGKNCLYENSKSDQGELCNCQISEVILYTHRLPLRILVCILSLNTVRGECEGGKRGIIKEKRKTTL